MKGKNHINIEEYTKQRYQIQDQQRKPTYKPYPHQRPGPNKEFQNCSQIEPDIKLKEFNFATLPIKNIRKFNWEEIRAVAISQSGTQGVIFVESDEGAIVVKGSSDMAIDFFLYKLARVMNVNVPTLRIVRYYDQEFDLILHNLQRATFCDEVLGRRVSSRLDMPFLQVMEYIPGISVEQMGPHRAALIFDHITPESRDRLIRLGMILAFDTLINNSDRYPLIWDGDGNAANIIVKMMTNFLTKTEQLKDINNLNIDFEKFYAIDSGWGQVNTTNEQGLKALQIYYNKLEDFLSSLFEDMKQVMMAQIDPLTEIGKDGKKKASSCLNKITNYLYNYTLYHLSEMQVFQIMLGIITGIENAIQLGINRISAMYQKFFLREKDDWKGVWNNNLRKINLQMYNDCIIIYNKQRQTNSDVIKWVKDITLNQYNINLEEFQQIMEGNLEQIEFSDYNNQSNLQNLFDDNNKDNQSIDNQQINHSLQKYEIINNSQINKDDQLQNLQINEGQQNINLNNIQSEINENDSNHPLNIKIKEIFDVQF
ncbi:hypothetical protein IMG5_148530 [Ichthyophthirius multifiliis]|uniref:Actin-fragmin kinase catalytic domain-containing protein n=1 Tax=Ichthyophthirius multifiliis TaxID=5932 RepID=G0QYA9_ICHMU|nr:hypothetical protein IMG5_148530 [Ichthyophthirius multifiliis]EGR29772.1 hypothetical protein IMG5_148530 [Ichthyophthirius multifiliis]|eukprot:XP_004031008.1 hypothetical protein IMG5_148530 [Ichthyophthirius multifiliis]